LVPQESDTLSKVRWIGLLAGPVAALAVYLLLPPSLRDLGGNPVTLAPAGRALAAVGVLMAVWWISEALPLEATALLPLALFPVLRIAPIKAAAAPYADPVIFLFMGGLILGLSMERWGLHRRIALYTIRVVGTRPSMLIAGVMLATAVMSMWVSNTATAVMMLPIGLSITLLVRERLEPERADAAPRFATCIMLAIAYAASIGGVGTIVGTPPNAVLAGIVNDSRNPVEPGLSFGRWMLIGVPVVAVFLPIAWLTLTRLYRIPGAALPGLRPAIQKMIMALGPMGRGEWATFVVFLSAAALWIAREPLGRVAAGRGGFWPGVAGLSDAGIAIMAALALFLIPVDIKRRVFAMDWAHAVRLPWGVLILFGGGLALAEGMSMTRLDAYLAAAMKVHGLHPLLIVLLLTAGMVFLTEIASNTAVATTFLPLALVLAREVGIHPFTLMIPLAIASSYAFMMPMGTPPNALVFASGHVTIRQMAGTGIILNLCAIVVITVMCYFLAPALLGFRVSP
jgi:sodium-dependent dicarboxylate transporter 2/3/5